MWLAALSRFSTGSDSGTHLIIPWVIWFFANEYLGCEKAEEPEKEGTSSLAKLFSMHLDSSFTHSDC